MPAKPISWILMLLLAALNASAAEEPWTAEEELQLMKLYQSGSPPYSEAAERLGKSQGEVAAKIEEFFQTGKFKRSVEGTVLDKAKLANAKPLTLEETNVFRTLFQEGYNGSLIAKFLHRSYEEVSLEYTELSGADVLLPPVEDDLFAVRFTGWEDGDTGCGSTRQFRFEIRDKASGDVTQISNECRRLGTVVYRMFLSSHRLIVLLQYPQMIAQTVALYDLKDRHWLDYFQANHVAVSPQKDCLAFVQHVPRNTQNYTGDVVMGYDLRKQPDENRVKGPVPYPLYGPGIPIYVLPSAQVVPPSFPPPQDMALDNVGSPLLWPPEGDGVVFITAEGGDRCFLVKTAVDREAWRATVRKEKLGSMIVPEKAPNTSENGGAEITTDKEDTCFSSKYLFWDKAPGVLVAYFPELAAEGRKDTVRIRVP